MLRCIAVIMLMSISVGFAEQKHEFHHPRQFLKQIAGKKDKGKQIYNQFCVMCHAQKPAINLGAPRIGILKEWKPRLEKGIDKMLAAIDPGLNAMPPRGGCFECSDDDLKQAILYMLPKEQKTKQ
jgi:cytochrome c5